MFFGAAARIVVRCTNSPTARQFVLAYSWKEQKQKVKKKERKKKAAYRSVDMKGNLLVERYKISTRHATKIECVFHNKNSVKITVFILFFILVYEYLFVRIAN